MRLITTLIIASIAGSTLVGGVRSFVNKPQTNPYRVVADLYKKDRQSTIRLIERASSSCVPELQKIKSREVRDIIPRVIILVVETYNPGGRKPSQQESRSAILKLIAPILQNASKADLDVLDQFFKQSKTKQSEIVSCIASTVAAISEETGDQPNALFSDVQLRGS
jgi:hypothetical protein